MGPSLRLMRFWLVCPLIASMVSCGWIDQTSPVDPILTLHLSQSTLARGRLDTAMVLITNTGPDSITIPLSDCIPPAVLVVTSPDGTRLSAPQPSIPCLLELSNAHLTVPPFGQAVLATLAYDGSVVDSLGRHTLLPPGGYYVHAEASGFPNTNAIPMTIAPFLPIDSLRASPSVSSSTFRVGDSVQIVVVVTNIGSQAASMPAGLCPRPFTVTTSAGLVVGPDSSSFCSGATPASVQLAAGAQTTLSFVWNGSSVLGSSARLSPGSYLVRSMIPGSVAPSSPAVAVTILP